MSTAGDDAQSVECQMECACLMSSVAGRAASLLIAGGALGAVEGMLERLGGNHRYFADEQINHLLSVVS